MTNSDSDETVYTTLLAGLANKLPEDMDAAIASLNTKDQEYARQIIEAGKIQLKRQR